MRSKGTRGLERGVVALNMRGDTPSVLSKTYFMVDDTEPILERAEGTEIQWKPGKNVTVKVRTSCRALPVALLALLWATPWVSASATHTYTHTHTSPVARRCNNAPGSGASLAWRARRERLA
jgi:hypothetical protein